MVTLQDVLSDLTEEAAEVDRLLSGLDDRQWQLPTPAPGWTIAHQVAHLTATFRMATLSARDPAAFQAMAGQLGADFDANVIAAMAPYVSLPPARLLSAWQAEHTGVVDALAAVPAEQMLPWLVRPLPPAVLASAGLMELFGHGQDILDALQVRREPTARLRSLVEFAVRTWDFGYQARGLSVPDTTFRFEIDGPDGDPWTFGPADADDRITAPALDFCLLVTRRRHPGDLAVAATGTEAEHWIAIAQAYRGPAGEGRVPGQFAAVRK